MPKLIDLQRTRYPLNYPRAKVAFEKEYFTYVLREFCGNVSHAADAIGLARRNVQIKIQQHHINVERMRK
jgi:DNA-binding NtrC family response regulator